MGLVDGVIDPGRIASVQAYAAGLRINERYISELAALAAGRPQALDEMTVLDMESVTNAPWPGGDVNQWLLPYGDDAADPPLATRFAALGDRGARPRGILARVVGRRRGDSGQLRTRLGFLVV